MTDDRELVGVVSPHLDDAAFSCGRLLRAHPGSIVVTVFSGGPAGVDPLPEWDELCGFSPGDDVMAIRRREDDEALATVGASASRLGFWEVQYRRPAGGRLSRRLAQPLMARLRPAGPPERGLVKAVAAALGAVVDHGPRRQWFVPLGLVHPDHRVTALAGLVVAEARPDLAWHLYEEQPYALDHPDLAAEARAGVARAGWRLDAAAPRLDPDVAAKDALARCYRSQVGYLAPRVARAVAGPEAYHRLVPVN